MPTAQMCYTLAIGTSASVLSEITGIAMCALAQIELFNGDSFVQQWHGLTSVLRPLLELIADSTSHRHLAATSAS